MRSNFQENYGNLQIEGDLAAIAVRGYTRFMRFTKMHGIGNDYVYINGFTESVADPGAVGGKVSDRHFGIGSDGLIMILPSDKADVRMRMFNVDGTEGEMCGNGVRCVAKYAFDHGIDQVQSHARRNRSRCADAGSEAR